MSLSIFLIVAQAGTLSPEPLAEVVQAMKLSGEKSSEMITHLISPPGRYRRASRFLKSGATDSPTFWAQRILKPEYHPSSPRVWMGYRYPYLDVLRYDKSLPNQEKLRVIDLMGATGAYLRHRDVGPLPTQQLAQDHVMSVIFRLTNHPSPQETNIGTYFNRVDLPSGRPLWYGKITLGLLLGPPEPGLPGRKILSPLDWHRHMEFFTDGRGTYIRPLQQDSTLPRATSGAKTPGGDGGRRILRF